MRQSLKIYILLGYGPSDSKYLCIVGATDEIDAIKIAEWHTKGCIIFKSEDIQVLPGGYDGEIKIFGGYYVA